MPVGIVASGPLIKIQQLPNNKVYLQEIHQNPKTMEQRHASLTDLNSIRDLSEAGL
jgi:hypothetical protein